MNAQRNNKTKTTLVKPEEGSVISERIIDHAGRDSRSYTFKHCIETGAIDLQISMILKL